MTDRSSTGRPAAAAPARRRPVPEDDRCTSPTAASRSWSSGAARRQVTLEWLAERLRDFVDLNPEFETPIERFATWLARLDDDDDVAPPV